MFALALRRLVFGIGTLAPLARDEVGRFGIALTGHLSALALRGDEPGEDDAPGFGHAPGQLGAVVVGGALSHHGDGIAPSLEIDLGNGAVLGVAVGLSLCGHSSPLLQVLVDELDHVGLGVDAVFGEGPATAFGDAGLDGFGDEAGSLLGGALAGAPADAGGLV